MIVLPISSSSERPISSTAAGFINRHLPPSSTTQMVSGEALIRSRYFSSLVRSASLLRLRSAVRSWTLLSSSSRDFRSSCSLSRRRFSARLRAALQELITKAENRKATVCGISRTVN